MENGIGKLTLYIYALVAGLMASNPLRAAINPENQPQGDYYHQGPETAQIDGIEIITAVLPPNTYQVGNLADGSCLTESGSTIIQSACSPLRNDHLWYWIYAGNSGGSSYYNLVNYSSGLCLDVAGGSYSDGALLTTTPCCPQCTSQWWRQQGSSPFPGSHQLRNLPSGKCAIMPLIPGTQNAWTGGPDYQATCGPYSNGWGGNQYWTLSQY